VRLARISIVRQFGSIHTPRKGEESPSGDLQELPAVAADQEHFGSRRPRDAVRSIAMTWQRAKFLEPTPSPEPFWVVAEPPSEHRFPPLNESADGFEKEQTDGLWYRTNVLEPHGHFFMWAPQHGVELFAEFAKEVQPDKRYLLGASL
jgi:hypothetical protein